MSYYWFDRKEILQSKKKKDILKKKLLSIIHKKGSNERKVKEQAQKLVKRRKSKIKEQQRKRQQELIQCKKEVLQNKLVLFLLSLKMSEKKLKFDNIRVKKKNVHKFKQPINLDQRRLTQINVDQLHKRRSNSSV